MIVTDDDGNFVEHTDGTLFTVLRVSELRKLLDEIQGDPFVYCNHLRNLAILDDGYSIVGTIHFTKREVEIFGRDGEE